MKTSTFWNARGIWLAFLFLVAVCGARAHDPFDCSTRMLVQPDQIEITVTMGLDAARSFLGSAGFPPPMVADIVRTRGPHSSLELSVELAPQLFDARIGGQVLAASQVTALSEGLEVFFNVFYPRPAAGTLELRAVFYERIADLRQGSFVAFDETMKPIAGVLLSRASVTAQVQLPPVDSGAAPVPAGMNPDSAPSANTPARQRPLFREFFKLGVEHILTGFDHLLFLGALLIGVRKPASMIGVITCFTLAHSVTLALAALNLAAISPRIIEPLIAASIVVVGVENLMRKDAPADRFWLVGGFGLIHGFGFAGALRDTGLGQAAGSIAGPLFSFNLGVEAGQLAVAALFVPALFLLRRQKGFARVGTPAFSAVVILLSGYWLVERTFFFR